MSVAAFFHTTCETRELHSDAQLRTRYYRNSFSQAKDAIEKLAAEERLEVRNVDAHHGEIYLLGNGYDIIVTATQVTPIETGIDLKINWFGFVGLGRPKKVALKFYQGFDRLLKFKGVSLHP
jgi:hypothetical protein